MPKLSTPRVKFCKDILNIRRKILGLYQRDIAEALRVNHMAVHNWETGKNQPKAKYIPLLAKVLKTKACRLMVPASDGK